MGSFVPPSFSFSRGCIGGLSFQDGEQHARSALNTLSPREPLRLPLDRLAGRSSLKPLEDVEVPIVLHANEVGDLSLSLMFIYREVCILLQRFYLTSRP